jgi:hypothetical protein
VWEVSIKLLEQYNMLQSNPQLKQFAWQAASVMQWHAFIHVLDTLRANPLIADAGKAWELIGNTYENNPAMVLDTGKPIHVAVGSLCLKAHSARAAALLLQNRNMCPPPTPGFILQLRQQREIAKAKRQARDTKSGQAEEPEARDMGPRPNAGVISSSDTLESTRLHQSAASHPPIIAQTGCGATGGDPFWLISGFDDSQACSLNDAMDMDLDFMVARNGSVEDNDISQTITWGQWDTWLAESNAGLSFSSARDLWVGT